MQNNATAHKAANILNDCTRRGVQRTGDIRHRGLLDLQIQIQAIICRGLLQHEVYVNNPHSLKEMEKNIRR